LKKSKK